jgi:HlyD family secretion protein
LFFFNICNAQPSEIVSPSSVGGSFTRTGICSIVDMSSIEVDVKESFIGRVSPGLQVLASLDVYPDWDILASWIATTPKADRANATVQVRMKIELQDAKILPDMGVIVGLSKDNEPQRIATKLKGK